MQWNEYVWILFYFFLPQAGKNLDISNWIITNRYCVFLVIGILIQALFFFIAD